MAADADGLEYYWHPHALEDANQLGGEAGGLGGFKECFADLDADAKTVELLESGVGGTAAPLSLFAERVEWDGPIPRVDIWWVKAKVSFHDEGVDSTFMSAPVPLKGVWLQVGVHWLPDLHRYGAGSIGAEGIW